VGLVLGALSLLPPTLGGLHWLLDLWNFATLQMACTLLVIAAIAAATRRKRAMIAALLIALVHAARIAPHIGASTMRAIGKPPLTLLVANIHAGNDEFALLPRLIEERAPDIVALSEVTPMWTAALDARLKRYPHRALQPRTDAFGVALYARVPIEALRVVRLDRAPAIRGRVALGTHTIDFAFVHVLPPVNSKRAATRSRQLHQIAAWAREARGPALITGDFNATPYSFHLRRTLREAGLVRAAGIGGTFPAMLPFALRFPIDHVLHTPDLVARARVDRDIGSDHFPLSVSVWPQPPPSPHTASPKPAQHPAP
jgi:endonuclease/exonuclease/phosphatase (EEP) superfamily protein YafD